MISADGGALLFYLGLFLMVLGTTGWLLHRFERELTQLLPRYEKANRVEEGEPGAV